MAKTFPGNKSKSGLLFKFTSEKRDKFIEIIELLNERVETEILFKLLFDLYFIDDGFRKQLAKAIEFDVIPKNDIKYLSLKKNTFGNDESGYKHFMSCCSKAFADKDYNDYKTIFSTCIMKYFCFADIDDLLDFLRISKEIKTNDEYIEKVGVTRINAIIYHATIDEVPGKITINNVEAFVKINNLLDATKDYFLSQIDMVSKYYSYADNKEEKDAEIKALKANFENKEKENKSLSKSLEDKNKQLSLLEDKLNNFEVTNKYNEAIIETYKETEVERDTYKKKYFELEDENKALSEENRKLLSSLTSLDSKINVSNEDLSKKIKGDFNENKFLDYFFMVLGKKGLCYDKEDIINFHVSCKASNLVILAGASGMGKTRLPLAYAECINAKESDDTLLFLPISPSYTEPSDVLGFYNSQKEEYIPSETGLVSFIKHAADHPDLMHMVIFDEMNLSQIEYWFAPFMSILEKPKGERILNLYDESNEKEDSFYPASITIGDNILFIGTINLDETTKDMSDRLVDRAIVINLKKLKFKDYYDQKPSENIEEYKCLNTDEYNSMRTNFDDRYISLLTKDEVEFFDDLHEILQKINSGKCVSHRNVKKIAFYLECTKHIDGFDRKVAFDYIFKQTILKKINGYDESIKEILGDLSDDDSIIDSKFYDLLKKSQKISAFQNTIAEMKSKIKEYKNYGFTR